MNFVNLTIMLTITVAGILLVKKLLGMKIKIVEGDERNLKVTTPLDLKIAEMLLEEMA